MNALLRILTILGTVSLLASGCASLPVQTGQNERAVTESAAYESIIGRSLTDSEVSEFLTGNECSTADQFLLCNTAGIALWIDSNQAVETVYLYLNNSDGFAPYKGDLPYGLKFYDTMEAVEYKLNRQGIGNAGLPDQTATPDRMHYQAMYHEAGMTIIYNFPFPDEGATIRAVVMTINREPR
jgi:hypothetical protein